MTFIQSLSVYALSVPVFFAIDMLWIGLIASGFYKSNLGHLMSSTVNWPVAIVFYLLFLIGLLIFAIAPALAQKSLMHAILFGALFGFFTYATYDLTNWATLKDWPPIVALVDMVWGTVLSASVAGLSYLLAVTFVVK
ncbi:MAG TPA: DUF2177 family protein [Candidatus Paceibacterota bacterium]|nr:DUF2177 family protein [Candidatus Paceibacterota bacterium]